MLVTGWNEWIAGRWGEPTGPLVFVDQLDQEFSRDIEPMTGGHGDNYYWQLVANVRRYKGASALPKASPPKTIRLKDGFEQWRGVSPELRITWRDAAPRLDGGRFALTNYSGRTIGREQGRPRQKCLFHVAPAKPITPAPARADGC